jgi:hypothetical protein
VAQVSDEEVVSWLYPISRARGLMKEKLPSGEESQKLVNKHVISKVVGFDQD